MHQTLPWILASVSLALLAAAAALWLAGRRHARARPLPDEWTLAARPVFDTDERRVYRLLREALPHHVVLAKLPLVRFCQPIDPGEVRYWYELLGQTHVTFAICSATGRVLAAIDLDTERGSSRRALQIKRSVLAACRIRYLRCPVDHLPSIPELQLLVPQGVAPARGPHPAPTNPMPLDAAGAGAARRRERATLWRDSGFFQDSFFGSYGRGSYGPPGDFSPQGGRPPDDDIDDPGGIVVDPPPARR
jgi:hypothetical protein